MKIGIIGFGKVGASLFDLLKEKKLKVNVYSKSKKKGNFEKVVKESEVIFICVKDDIIPEVVRKIKKLKIKEKKHFLHLSGATSLTVLDTLKRKGHNTGKLHPVQTFSKRDKNAFKKIYATFSGNEETFKILKKIFQGDLKIIKMKDEEQVLVHIACVFASNFSVYLLIKAEEILKEINLNMEVLKPIIKTSFENVLKFGPSNSLTGPAKRRDIKTIKRHLKVLKKFKKDLFLIYNYISKKILKNGRKI